MNDEDDLAAFLRWMLIGIAFIIVLLIKIFVK